MAILVPLYFLSAQQCPAVDSATRVDNLESRFGSYGTRGHRTTYERLLPFAEAGDADVQNLLGFMFYYAEGVDLDYDQAHAWFHRAAEQGNLMAQRNLGLFHAKSRPRVPDIYFDPVEANFWFSLVAAGTPGGSKLASRSYEAFTAPMYEEETVPLEQRNIGQNIFITYCAGCHGFDGRAAYLTAPSFVLGETLAQADEVLVGHILDGKGTMPAWRNTISEAQALKVLGYIRTRFQENKDPVPDLSSTPLPPKLAEKTNILELGEKIYAKFCAGCHGFNGISYYVNSPSFALNERLGKSDAELAHSINKGRGVMPSWEMMLSPGQVMALVGFIRTLAPAYESGIDQELRVPPDLYFLFKPLGETRNDWHNRGGN